MNDLEFAKSQNDWPTWPYLPLKRDKEGDREIGFLAGSLKEYVKPIVYLSNIFMPKFEDKIEYRSLEEVFADGWRVD